MMRLLKLYIQLSIIILLMFYTPVYPECPPAYIFCGEAENDWFGTSVSSAGDVNRDGFDDLIVGASLNDAGGVIAGRAYVYSGQDGVLIYTFTGEAEFNYFGSSVSGAGDVNGDGYADLIIGAHGHAALGDNTGRAYVYSGQNGTLLYTFTGEAELDYFGCSVSGAGDVNNDSFDDVIVGAYSNDAGGPDAGRAYVYSGKDGEPLYILTGEMADDAFGRSVSTAGDVNNDGFDDVIVGAHGSSNNGQKTGRAYVYSGQSGDLLYAFTGEEDKDQFGWPVSSAGDVNNDGYADLIVGANRNDAAGIDAGRAYVYSGRNGGLLHIFTGEGEKYRFGWSVSEAGDINGDSFDDLIIGTWGGVAEQAYLYSGQDGTLLEIFTGGEMSEWFGWSVSGTGDINNDGFNDLIIGAYYADHFGNENVGRAYVYLGGPCGATINVPSDLPTIQAGIDAANPGDTVLVSDGIYMGIGNRDIDFKGKNVIVKSENGPDNTIINCQGDAVSPHRGFHFHNGESSASVVNGFTIVNGYGPFDGPSGISVGGAISCDYYSNPIITNNIIKECFAESNGGGIYCNNNSYPDITGNTIRENSAGWRGGAIYVGGRLGILIDSNRIIGNSAGRGGGICIRSTTGSQIINNFIGENQADEGGGIYCMLNYYTSIINNIIIENTAVDTGGGIWIRATSGWTFANNTICRNLADVGGGIHLLSSFGTEIYNTIVAFNSSESGIAPIDCYTSNNPSLLNCNIYGNENGDWEGCIADQFGINGNISLDPLFCDTANNDYHISTFSACAPENNTGGKLIGALAVNCGMTSAQTVIFDIKPGSNPNPINIKDNHKGKSVISAAILGTEDFDVHDIDISSLHLAGIAPSRWAFEDEVAATDKSNSCTCTEDGPDGFDDLILKFDKSIMIITVLNHSNDSALAITGMLIDSTHIIGHDCIEIRSHGNISIDSVTGEIIVVSAMGDVNEDGMVNLQDVSAIIDALYGNGSNIALDISAGDVDCSGDINMLDLTTVLNHLYKNGPEPGCHNTKYVGE